MVRSRLHVYYYVTVENLSSYDCSPTEERVATNQKRRPKTRGDDWGLEIQIEARDVRETAEHTSV